MEKQLERQFAGLIDSSASTKGLSVEDYARLLIKNNAPTIVECPNCHHKYIMLNKALKVKGGTRPKRYPAGKTNVDWTAEDLQKAMELEKAGTPIQAIADAMGRSKQSVYSKLWAEKRKK